jgi:hypothetical protein
LCFQHSQKFAQNNASKTTDNKTKLLLKKTPKVEVAPKSIHPCQACVFCIHRKDAIDQCRNHFDAAKIGLGGFKVDREYHSSGGLFLVWISWQPDT